MRRLPGYCGLSCTLLTLSGALVLHELSLQDGRADDPNAAVAGPNGAAQPPKVAAGQPKKSARNKQNADTTALRAQRAQAQRAAIANEEMYGPGSTDGGYSPVGRGMNGILSGNSAFGGTGFGGSIFGSGIGSSLGGGSSTGTGTSTAGTTAGTQSPGAGTGTTGTQAQTGNSSTTIPYLNQKVLEFATYNLGKQVGSGVCWELGADALAYANAEPPHGQVFGDQVSLAEMLPGDILEFDNARFAGANYWLSLGAPYHTAIVSSVQGDSIAMLNQNINNVKVVQMTIIHLADLRSGTIAVYRPVARQ